LRTPSQASRAACTRMRRCGEERNQPPFGVAEFQRRRDPAASRSCLVVTRQWAAVLLMLGVVVLDQMPSRLGLLQYWAVAGVSAVCGGPGSAGPRGSGAFALQTTTGARFQIDEGLPRSGTEECEDCSDDMVTIWARIHSLRLLRSPRTLPAERTTFNPIKLEMSPIKAVQLDISAFQAPVGNCCNFLMYAKTTLGPVVQ